MSNQNLIIYNLSSLYNILNELDLNFNFKIFFVDNQNSLYEKNKFLNECLIISENENLDLKNKISLDNSPIRIFELIEKINIEFLKLKFSNQSEIKINNYTIDLNAREMILNDVKIKLTEKEINIILYLSKSTKPIKVNELQKNVWRYQSDTETHTVETHIYRLRKKIFDRFKDDKLIISVKNGYQIK